MYFANLGVPLLPNGVYWFLYYLMEGYRVCFACFEMFWDVQAQAFYHHTEKVVIGAKRSNHLHIVDSVTPRCNY